MGAVHAIIPVKSLSQAKSRLASTLSPSERRALALTMLERVLKVVTMATVYHLHTVWVTSHDSQVLNLATRYGTHPLVDTTDSLNAALEQAKTAAAHAGAEAVLVIPADMPLITSGDVTGLVQTLQQMMPVTTRQDTSVPPPACVIAPDKDASGTNALGLTLPTPMSFQFGTDSFAGYLEMARHLGVRVQVYSSPTLALDVDTPDDLARVWHTLYPWRRHTDGDHRLCCGT